METTLSVPKIRCDGCAATIRTALSAVPGVRVTDVAVASQTVRVEFDPARVDEAGVREALAGAGFPAA
jgi:copper chaperone CopZ